MTLVSGVEFSRGAPMDVIILISIVCGGAVILLAVYDRWVLPLIAKWNFNRMYSKFKAGKLGKPGPAFPSKHAISVEQDGFKIINVKDSTWIPISRTWSEVLRVVSFKRDLFTVDLICLQLTFMELESVEVDEDMGGWQEFVEALPGSLPGARPFSEWFKDVAFPAFATNETIVYDRNSGTHLSCAADSLPSERPDQGEFIP